MTDRRSRPPSRAPRQAEDDADAPRATRDDIVALIAQLAVPQNRLAEGNFPELAKALVREARRHGITAPAWLAAIAGYRQPPPPLALLRGPTGRRETRPRIVDRSDAGGAMIVTGVPRMPGPASSRSRPRRSRPEPDRET